MKLSSRGLAAYLFCPEGRQLERVIIHIGFLSSEKILSPDRKASQLCLSALCYNAVRLHASLRFNGESH